MKLSKKTTTLILLMLSMASVHALVASGTNFIYGREHESEDERNKRMAWWREAKFGMFIHWGIYAVPAGSHKGEVSKRHIGEWIMHTLNIPVEEYKAYADEFTVSDYDPERWVKLAKKAGMKYIVITTKHHDGFSLFDSKVTDWDIVDATPYGKDVIGPLVEACRKHDMKIGFYYSQHLDWVHPGGGNVKRWDDAQKGDYDLYLQNIVIPHLKELLTNYGKIDVLWYDIPANLDYEKKKQFDFVTKLQPDIIVNNRLMHNKKYGDFLTPEQSIGGEGLWVDWETCMTMNRTWGYRADDHNWKDLKKILDYMVATSSRGGNFLFNVGPTKEGVIPQPSVEKLKEVGEWMDIYGEAIYGSDKSPFPAEKWGNYTSKQGKLYALVQEWPTHGKLDVRSGDVEYKNIYLLNNHKTLNWEKTPHGIRVDVPKTAPHEAVSVIVLEKKHDLPWVSQVPGILQDKTYFYEMPELKGRYVRIEHSKRKKLDLVEVKVVSGDENIAINKKATQSHLNGKRVARLAIDGDMETYSSVGRPNASSWWELDLGSAQNVDKIEIYNEQSKSRFFDGFNVSVLDENRTLIWEMKNCRQGLKTVFQGEVPRLNVNEKFTALRPNTSVD